MASASSNGSVGDRRADAADRDIDDADLQARSTISIQHSGPIRRLILCGLLLIAAIAVGTAVMIGNFRERALANSERELENTVTLLVRHFDQQLEDFQVIQNDLVVFMQSAEINSNQAYRSRMSTLEAHEMLRVKLSATSYDGSVNLFDSDGWLINSSGAWPVPDVTVADRAYFKTFKSDPQSATVLVEAVKNLDSGVWTTVIAHKLTGPNGEFLGVIGRGIEPIYFKKFFASLALGEGASIALLHQDGTMLARHPHVEAMIGRNFKTGPLFENILSKTDHGTMLLNSPVDGQDRVAAVRRLSQFPIGVVATMTVSAALADWRQQTRLLIGVAVSSVLVIAIMLFLIVRQLSREHAKFSSEQTRSRQRLALEKQRLDIALNNMTQGLLLYDSSQRLVLCNQRYIDMYSVSPDVVKPGRSFRELIAHRKETGSFKGNVDDYVASVLGNVAAGKVTHTVVATADGRSIQVVN